MGNRDSRNRPAHMASRGGKRSNMEERRARREPLRDNYYYEESSEEFEDLSSYSSPQKRKEDQRELERQRGNAKKKMSTGKKVALIAAAVLVLLIAGSIWYVFGYMLKGLTVEPITKDPVKLGWELPSGTSMPEDDFEVVLDDNIINIAMFGVDARDSSFVGRSDVVMILTIDNKHKKIKMTSVARDTCVAIEDYGYDKLTHAYFYGGQDLAVNTLNRNFHLRMEDYVTVNFARMAQIIDACGGVDIELTGEEIVELNMNLWYLMVDVQDAIEDDKWAGTYQNRWDYAIILNEDIIPNIYGERNLYSQDYEYENGVYHLNGNQAVAYGRIRHLAGGDDVRMGRQQNVLKALIQQVRGKSKLEYPEMIRKIMPMCKTSLDFNDIMKMLPIMFTDFTIETITLPTEVESPYGGFIRKDCWVYLYDLEAASKHISQFIYEADSPYYRQPIEAGYGYPPVTTVEGGDDPDAGPSEGLTSSSAEGSYGPSSGGGISSASSEGEGSEGYEGGSGGEEGGEGESPGGDENAGGSDEGDGGGGDSGGDDGGGEVDEGDIYLGDNE